MTKKTTKKSFRPTKVASKRRRELLNTEISEIRDLLPVLEVQRQRLSQLQVMSLCNAYVSLNNFVTRHFKTDSSANEIIDGLNMSMLLPGFSIVVTTSGQMLYASENVTDYLGFSTVELLTQGDTIYDMMEKEDHDVLRLVLENTSSFPTTEIRSLTCRMFVAQNFRSQCGYSRHRTMNVEGRLLQPSPQPNGSKCEPIFVAVFSPKSRHSENSTTMHFQSIHDVDMKYLSLEHNGHVLLGYTSAEIPSKSWYESFHPEDISILQRKHLELLRNTKPDKKTCSFSARAQTRYGHFVWMNVEMYLHSPPNGRFVVCNNTITKEAETNRNHQTKMMMPKIEQNDRLVRGEVMSSRLFELENGSVTVGSVEREESLRSKRLFSSLASVNSDDDVRCKRRRLSPKSDVETAPEIGKTDDEDPVVAAGRSKSSTYPILKQILERPPVRLCTSMNNASNASDHPGQRSKNPASSSPPFPESSILAAQNSLSDFRSSDVRANENGVLVQNGVPTPECSDFDVVQMSSSDEKSPSSDENDDVQMFHDVWYSEIPASEAAAAASMSGERRFQMSLAGERSQSLSHDDDSGFKDIPSSAVADANFDFQLPSFEEVCGGGSGVHCGYRMLIDCIDEMQVDSQMCRDLEDLDLDMFGECFSELGTSSSEQSVVSSTSDLQSNEASLTSLVKAIMASYGPAPPNRLSCEQIERLNQRLADLKKLHETMIFKAVVETLHGDCLAEPPPTVMMSFSPSTAMDLTRTTATATSSIQKNYGLLNSLLVKNDCDLLKAIATGGGGLPSTMNNGRRTKNGLEMMMTVNS